jgi:carotenoid cleavage dioxygenase-like enzyme
VGLTTNLFWGQGPIDHQLRVVEGQWPSDIAGSVFVVGPDKRAPGGHWFDQHGLLQKIHLSPEADGTIRVEQQRIRTPLERLRRALPALFRVAEFAEVSPFGVTNLANTNVSCIDGRLFVGYDAGRPVEVDPDTMGFVTFVGANDEWINSSPAPIEPLCAVAAHPAVDVEEACLYFLNYNVVTAPFCPPDASLARWNLDGPVTRWSLRGMSSFDSLHDVKTTRNHVVFCDLPFVFEPQTFLGRARTRRAQSHTTLWIVAKASLRETPAGGEVPVVEVQIPLPTGHLSVDYDERDGELCVYLQHIPLSDLTLRTTRSSVRHDNGALVDPNYAGLVAVPVQPSVVGRYRIDPVSGAVRSSELAHDDAQAWGGLLATHDVWSSEARGRQRSLWYAGMGFDPALVTQEWWNLYGAATDGIVAPASLPSHPLDGTLARVDLESMKFADVFRYADGAFPGAPTFVPRATAVEPDDGYVVVTVHRDGPKEIHVFDAQDIERGPVARATAPTFNPGLLLHSTWMPPAAQPRKSGYRVRWWRDLFGAARGVAPAFAGLARAGRAMRTTAAR